MGKVFTLTIIVVISLIIACMTTWAPLAIYYSPLSGEDVYLYRLKFNRERAHKLFMEYIKQINAMKKRPVWYNTLTTNCITNIVMHIKTFSDRIHYNWKILLSGYTPLYAYEIGALNTDLPFAELRKKSHINPRAHVIGNDPEFSRKIREGLARPSVKGTKPQSGRRVSQAPLAADRNNITWKMARLTKE